MRRHRCHLFLIVCGIVGLFMSLPARGRVHAQSDQRCFNETGYCSTPMNGYGRTFLGVGSRGY